MSWSARLITANRHYLEPREAVQRDRRLLGAASTKLESAAAHKSLADPANPGSQLPVAASLSAAADALSRSKANADTIEDLDDVLAAASELRDSVPAGSPKYIQQLPELLEEVVEIERLEHPRLTALNYLGEQCPAFLELTQDDRNLDSVYDLTQVADAPPRALANLAQLAELDLLALRDAKATEQHARAVEMVRDANQRLEEAFHDAWKQAKVHVRLDTDGTLLRIFVSGTKNSYTEIAERSDGLRAFIALLTFTALHAGGARVVLLVDEAENHLHYDAQADIVRVFSQQRAAEQVIYTTHSAGCLPNDLGAIRLTEAHPDETSSVKNAFWTDGPGLSPLLIGMGASVMAFTPSRRAVFVEGGADLVLLPPLLREATNQDDLHFQMVPGLAEVRPDQVSGLDLEAAAVAYLVDGDDAGRGIRSKLKGLEVPDDKIVVLGGDKSGLVVEDFVRADVYADAVGRLLFRSYGHGVSTPTAAELGDVNRPGALAAWAADKNLEPPNKVPLAYEVLAIGSEGQSILDVDRALLARRTYMDAARAVNLEL